MRPLRIDNLWRHDAPSGVGGSDDPIVDESTEASASCAFRTKEMQALGLVLEAPSAVIFTVSGKEPLGVPRAAPSTSLHLVP